MDICRSTCFSPTGSDGGKAPPPARRLIPKALRRLVVRNLGLEELDDCLRAAVDMSIPGDPVIRIDSSPRASSLAPMPSTRLNELVPVLQVAVGPVILISGIGLLLLSLTNRFGRAVDRSRQLIREMREASDTDRLRLAGQVEILYRRARLIQIAIILAAMSVLFAAVLIIVLFFTALLKLELAVLISLLFICCLASLIVSLISFIMDIHLSLKALGLELGHEKPDVDQII
jgi:hypothetical protein